MSGWFVVVAAAADADAAAAALWAAGAETIEEFWRSDGAVELRVEIDPRPGVDGSGVDGSDVDTWRAALPEHLGWRVEHDDTARPRPHRASAPIRATERLLIVPVGVTAPDTRSLAGSRAGSPVAVMSLETGGTFGTGDHPTTLACLRLLDEVMQLRAAPRVLDVGCGSGVLGIAALLWGASHALGVDITAEAMAVSDANAARNGVAQRWRAITEPLGTIGATFDVVAANVLGPALVGLAPDLRRLVAPGGVLIVSGVLAGADGPVLEALAPLQVARRVEADGWLAALLSAPAPTGR